MSDAIEPGQAIEVPYPFVREEVSLADADGIGPVKSWRPGTRAEPIAPDDYGLFADALGTMILTVVSLHKPGKYPERVFYTRRWRSPTGKEFGKGNLHIRSVGHFRHLCRGYRHHFKVEPPQDAQHLERDG